MTTFIHNAVRSKVSGRAPLRQRVCIWVSIYTHLHIDSLISAHRQSQSNSHQDLTMLPPNSSLIKHRAGGASGGKVRRCDATNETASYKTRPLHSPIKGTLTGLTPMGISLVGSPIWKLGTLYFSIGILELLQFFMEVWTFWGFKKTNFFCIPLRIAECSRMFPKVRRQEECLAF